MEEMKIFEEVKGEEKDEPFLIERLVRNYAKVNQGGVSGLGSGTYGLVFFVKGGGGF